MEKFDPMSNPFSYLSLGTVAMRDGQFAQAMQSYLSAFDFLPEHRDIISADIGILQARWRSTLHNQKEKNSKIFLHVDSKYHDAPLIRHEQEDFQQVSIDVICNSVVSEGPLQKAIHLDTTARDELPRCALEFVAANPCALVEIAELNGDTLLVGLLYEAIWMANVRIRKQTLEATLDRDSYEMAEYFEKKNSTAVSMAACVNIDHRVDYIFKNLQI